MGRGLPHTLDGQEREGDCACREASRKRLRGGCYQRVSARGHEFSFKAPAATDKRDGGCGIALHEKVRRRESGFEVTGCTTGSEDHVHGDGPLSAPQGLGRAASSQRASGTGFLTSKGHEHADGCQSGNQR